MTVVTLLAGGTKPAHATLTLSFTGKTAVGTIPATYNYDVFLSGFDNQGDPVANEIDTGDFINIIDFAGFNGTSTQPAGFAAPTSQFTGPVPTDTTGNPYTYPTDDPAIPNLIFAYTGASGVYSVGAGIQPQLIGKITVNSLFDIGGNGNDAAQSHVTESSVTIAKNSPITVAVASTPEPGSMVLFGLGALGLFGVVQKRRRGAKGLAESEEQPTS